ncbi:MAG: hypothetical protein EGQ16_05615 [Clostridiales bacterium]|nr:hypothetical protein [Clostridiales bacterium]
MKKTIIKIVSIVAIVAILITAGVLLYIKVIKPHNEAVSKYNEAAQNIKEKNEELDNKVKKVQGLIDSNEKVIDEKVITNAKEAKKKAEASKYVLGKMPSKTKEIISKTEELSKPLDYTEILNELEKAYNEYDTSIKQYKQLTNPSEEFVIQRLQTIEEIADARAVTEDNDPNGKLNKPGGYTATVYFESKNIKQSEVYGNDIIEKGTKAGGAIEVYANEEDAKNREDYLAGFDGGILSSGSHKVVGTVLIRTSDDLTATQQKNLEEKIVKALSELK